MADEFHDNREQTFQTEGIVGNERAMVLLHKLLDEYGLSYQTQYLHTSWRVGSKVYEAVDNLDGTLTVDYLTPGQAIAATLYSGTTEFVSATSCRHVDQEDGVKSPDSIERSEKEALIDALTAIASAISFCETDMQIVVQDRLNLVYDAIERLNGM